MQFALRFISGKYQGGEFALQDNSEIVVGRSSELDMVLVEDMVSRKHAKITTTESQVIIQDLGSTNGTFVNGERIKKASLKEGDRILVGTSILKVIPAEASEATVPLNGDGLRSMMEQVARQRRSSSPMSGRIDEVPLPDLLQLFSTSKKSGVMLVRSADSEGKVFLREGKIYYASIDEDHEIGPKKAFNRMIGWTTGLFELTDSSAETFSSSLDENTEALLMDAMREMDELQRLSDKTPDLSKDCGLVQPMSARLRELSAEQLDVLQLVHNYSTWQIVLNKSVLSDLETTQALVFLLSRDYIKETT
jgi:hypothetical protein